MNNLENAKKIVACYLLPVQTTRTKYQVTRASNAFGIALVDSHSRHRISTAAEVVSKQWQATWQTPVGCGPSHPSTASPQSHLSFQQAPPLRCRCCDPDTRRPAGWTCLAAVRPATPAAPTRPQRIAATPTVLTAIDTTPPYQAHQ